MSVTCAIDLIEENFEKNVYCLLYELHICFEE